MVSRPARLERLFGLRPAPGLRANPRYPPIRLPASFFLWDVVECEARWRTEVRVRAAVRSVETVACLFRSLRYRCRGRRLAETSGSLRCRKKVRSCTGLRAYRLGQGGVRRVCRSFRMSALGASVAGSSSMKTPVVQIYYDLERRVWYAQHPWHGGRSPITADDYSALLRLFDDLALSAMTSIVETEHKVAQVKIA